MFSGISSIPLVIVFLGLNILVLLSINFSCFQGVNRNPKKKNKFKIGTNTTALSLIQDLILTIFLSHHSKLFVSN